MSNILLNLWSIFFSNNMITLLSNVIFYIVVQTLFFYFIGSKQFNNVLENKVDIVVSYAKKNIYLKEFIKEYISNENAKKLEKEAKKQKKKREKYNRSLIFKWIGIPLLICIVVLLINIFKLFILGESWGRSDNIILLLVIFAYSTELCFFFGIVKQYEFYGDHKIYRSFFENCINNIVTKIDTVTKKND